MNNNIWLNEKPEGFLERLKDASHARVWCREFIKNYGPESLVEVGVGGLNERIALSDILKEGKIKYIGTDWTPGFVANGKKRFPKDRWELVNIMQTPPPQGDVIYSQHVLEHCPGLCPALSNMLESAGRYLINIFFLPLEEKDRLDSFMYPLYHNVYSREHVTRVCEYHGFKVELKDFDNSDLHDGDPQRETVLIATRR